MHRHVDGEDIQAFLDDLVTVVPPTIIIISLMGGLGRSFSR